MWKRCGWGSVRPGAAAAARQAIPPAAISVPKFAAASDDVPQLLSYIRAPHRSLDFRSRRQCLRFDSRGAAAIREAQRRHLHTRSVPARVIGGCTPRCKDTDDALRFRTDACPAGIRSRACARQAANLRTIGLELAAGVHDGGFCLRVAGYQRSVSASFIGERPLKSRRKCIVRPVRAHSLASAPCEVAAYDLAAHRAILGDRLSNSQELPTDRSPHVYFSCPLSKSTSPERP